MQLEYGCLSQGATLWGVQLFPGGLLSSTAKIPGGFIIIARKLLESDLMETPPLWFKLWCWMLIKASHTDHGNLERGQFFTTYGEMQKAMSYFIGARKIVPTMRQIRRPLERFTKVKMAVTSKVTHGIIITIVNYDYYQNPINYEGHTEGQTKVGRRSTEGHNINKNGNKNDISLEKFEQFYSLYPRRVGKKPALKAWEKNPDLSNGLFEILIKALQKQKETIFKDRELQFIPHPATWLNGRRWEDETGTGTLNMGKGWA